ncbi:hypothetical protein [Achromobacter kerstersii]|uniref:hypothetical protein n=1 Tax=Achromobacter kerstersii TaxID=1353890 RepID=UPI0032086CC1
MYKVEVPTMTMGRSFVKQGQTSETNASFADALQDAQRGVDRLQIKKSPPVLSDAEQELQDFVAMSPEERFFDLTLRSLGISKEEYAAMSPAEKEEVARLVQQRIAERIKDNANNGRASTFELA